MHVPVVVVAVAVAVMSYLFLFNLNPCTLLDIKGKYLFLLFACFLFVCLSLLGIQEMGIPEAIVNAIESLPTGNYILRCFVSF